ncbi:MAG: hypothetical protein A2X48_18275 [Lentisphaerae bacterium GWF2_49_21]|nr:MAG: hypothetical protein A2X48_18275 [Lentisphaerae bacterium GWF2_49_21]
MKKKILITGCLGFIGRNLYASLKDRYEVFCVDCAAKPAGIQKNYFRVDLLDSKSVANFAGKVSGKHFAAVIHTAFLLCGKNDRRSFDYFRKNNLITENMIRLLDAIKFDTLINFSSLAVYPVRNGSFSEESESNMSANTECLYGISKFNSEMLFSFFLGGKSKVVNLRLCQVYGPGMQDDRLVGAFRKELSEKNTITVYGNGKRISNFLHVSDLCGAVRTVLEEPVTGTYNLGCSRNISYRELAEKIISAKGDKFSKIVKVPQGSSAKAAIGTFKFEKTFKYKCKTQDFGF